MLSDGAHSHSLPVQPGPLFGRGADRSVISGLLLDSKARLITLTGGPGVGKTRLALAVAHDLLARLPEGVCFVDLLTVQDVALIPTAVASILGIQEQPGKSILDTLKQHLHSRRQLIVLDNFEQLLPAVPHLPDFLDSCPHLQLVVTSREPLRLPMERLFTVEPLETPDLHRLPNPEELASCPSVALFLARTRSIRPRFALNPLNAHLVAEICSRLEGVPLAIELAAAQSDALGPQEILSGLDKKGIDLLATNDQNSSHRHHTLRSAIHWSHQLLSLRQKRLFRRLSSFLGSATLRAIESVCVIDEQPMIDPLLDVASLVRKSLLKRDETPDGESRYHMLEMIRAFAQDQLLASGEEATIKDRHADYFLRLAETAEPNLMGPHQAVWLERLDREHDNIRAALDWLQEKGEVEEGLRMGRALWWFWYMRGHYRDGRERLERLLTSEAEVGTSPERARVLAASGELARLNGDYSLAEEHQREALRICHQLGDKRGMAEALRMLATTLSLVGDTVSAQTMAEESLTLSRESGNSRGIGMALAVLAQNALLKDDNGLARSLAQESLTIWRELGDKRAIGATLFYLAVASTFLRDFGAANTALAEDLRIGEELQDGWRIVWALQGFALLAAAEGHAKRALRLAGAATTMREATAVGLPAFTQGVYEKRLERAMHSLGEKAAADALDEGRAMGREKAIAYALRNDSPTPAQDASESRSPEGTTTLSVREHQVAGLVARGLSNAEIAEMLAITRRTAVTHVAHTLSKLGFSNRAQIAAWVVREGLVSSSLE